MTNEEKKIAKIMQKIHFKKHKEKITLEEALIEFYDLMQWHRTEGREFREKNPIKHQEIADKIIKRREKNTHDSN